MIFEYEELKECVEDFERFYKIGFNEKQIYSAVLNEFLEQIKHVMNIIFDISKALISLN